MVEALLLITWFDFFLVVCCTHEVWRQPDLSRLKLLTNERARKRIFVVVRLVSEYCEGTFDVFL